MISALTLVLALFAEPVPGDALRLAPGPSVGASPAAAAVAPPAPSTPALPIPAALAAVAAGIVALATGIRRQGSGATATAPAEPLVVFVSGHGSPPAPGVFAHLVEMMGLDPSQARYFDYRWADGGSDHTQASQGADIDETADALAGYLAGLSALGRPIYLVGHSKGGAGIAELVARWDQGQPGAAGVQGAALLDPPMASGLHGLLQSLGMLWGPLADDGGYDPVRCSLWECEDSRDYLGAASGVPVVVVRNPQSGVANFADVPAGLRVYDAADGGPGLLQTLFTRPWAIFARISAAHNAVLHDPRVADCVVAEMRRPGTCSLPLADPAGGLPAWLEGLVPDEQWEALPGSAVGGGSLRAPSIV